MSRSLLSLTRITPGPDGSMLAAPLRGRVLLPPAALSERLWQAYALALNSDEETTSPKGYGRFRDELWDLHDQICGRVFGRISDRVEPTVFAFAERWRLRRVDAWNTVQMIEIHDRPGAAREDSMFLQLPLVVHPARADLTAEEVSPELPPLVYDLTQTTGQRVREEAKRRFDATMRAIASAEERWLREGHLARVQAQHADPTMLVGYVRRWVRRVKGWTLGQIAADAGITLSTLRSSLEPWRRLDKDRIRHDAGFSTSE